MEDVGCLMCGTTRAALAFARGYGGSHQSGCVCSVDCEGLTHVGMRFFGSIYLKLNWDMRLASRLHNQRTRMRAAPRRHLYASRHIRQSQEAECGRPMGIASDTDLGHLGDIR